MVHLVGHLLKRGFQASHDHIVSQAVEKLDGGVIKIPVWGSVVLYATLVLFAVLALSVCECLGVSISLSPADPF